MPWDWTKTARVVDSGFAKTVSKNFVVAWRDGVKMGARTMIVDRRRASPAKLLP